MFRSITFSENVAVNFHFAFAPVYCVTAMYCTEIFYRIYVRKFCDTMLRKPERGVGGGGLRGSERKEIGITTNNIDVENSRVIEKLRTFDNSFCGTENSSRICIIHIYRENSATRS